VKELVLKTTKQSGISRRLTPRLKRKHRLRLIFVADDDAQSGLSWVEARQLNTNEIFFVLPERLNGRGKRWTLFASFGKSWSGRRLGATLFHAIKQCPARSVFAEADEIDVNTRTEQAGRLAFGHTNWYKESKFAGQVRSESGSPFGFGKPRSKESRRENSVRLHRIRLTNHMGRPRPAN
jgi:hypothetical protein